MHCCELSIGGTVRPLSQSDGGKTNLSAQRGHVSVFTCPVFCLVSFFCEFAGRFLDCNSNLWCTCIWEVYTIQYCQLDDTYLPHVIPSYDSVSLQAIISVYVTPIICCFTIL